MMASTVTTTGVDERLRAVQRLLGREWSHFIGNEFDTATSGPRVAVTSPATGETLGTIVAGNAEDVDRAVAAALAAQEGWEALGVLKRVDAVLRVGEALEAHAEELALLDALDNGSPLTMMRGDVALALRQLRYLAGIALEHRGQTIPTADRDSLDFTQYQAYGVVGRIIPFNHPLMFAISKTVVPLITGNSVVLKPSMETSLSALRFAEIAAEVLPAGVLNVVTGDGTTVGSHLVEHPDVPRIAFIGSVGVGLEIQRRAATNTVKHVTLELGGKNPLIVFDDADLDAAVDGAVKGMNFTWQGQSCGSTSRIYVHRAVWDEFIDRMGARLDALVVGNPLDSTSDVGAIVSERQFESVRAYLDIGQEDPGARLVCGGLPKGAPQGNYIRPTLFAFDRGGSSSRLVNEEIFGPIVVAIPFDSYDEVIHEANRLDVGLTASVWTQSLGVAMRASRDLEAGYVWINESSVHLPGAPYGGQKNSGLGREEGLEEYYSFTQQKNVYIKFSESGARHE